MYDFTSSKWTELTNLRQARIGHGCGTATKSDGSSVAVVAGGLGTNSVEIYNFNVGTWK